MATDLYFDETGDIGVSSKGDIAITPSHRHLIEQNVRTRLATRRSDFLPYPSFGADMQRLVGLPNSPQTARFGKALIERSLQYDGFLAGSKITVEATPTAPDVIEFDVYIPYDRKKHIAVTLTQLLVAGNQ